MRTEYVRAREGNSLISIIVVVHRDRNISTKMRLQLRQREANANKAIRSRLSTNARLDALHFRTLSVSA